MKMFHQPDSEIANGIFKKWNTLYDECLRNDVELVALNTVINFNEVDFFVFADFPRMKNPIVQKVFASNKPKVLIIEEGPLIHSENWKQDNHELFDFVFTWNDDLVDNVKYFKFNVHYVEDMAPSLHLKEKLCVLIARNKRAWGKNELYTERRNAIKYFESNHNTKFDLYGDGWDKFYFPSNVPILRLFNGSKLFWLRSRLKENYPSWKGSVSNKLNIMKKYKFSISYENSIGPTGYISEKIWDSFAAGTVPIYFGAPNILNHIPANCFIDFRDFSNYDKLYKYISEMSDELYESYLINIEKFLKKEQNGGQFSDKYFVNSFMNLIKKVY